MRTTAPPVTALVNSPIFMLVVYLGSVVSRLSLVLFIFFAIVLVQTGYAGKAEFKEYLKQAKVLKDDVVKSSSGFDPKKIFDNYSSDPASAKYYNEESASAIQTLKLDSISSLTLNKEGQAIAESSKIRPQFKINSESEEIKNSNKIQILAAKNIKGTVEGFLAGEEEQINTQGTKYIIKTCNEEIRALKRVCDKTPEVSIVAKASLYPNCHKLVVIRGNQSCPGGYNQVLYASFYNNDRNNDIRFCTKLVTTANESPECYGCYGVVSADLLLSRNTGVAVVPKNRHGFVRGYNTFRVAFGSIRGPMITVINETTKQTVYYEVDTVNEQILQLPFFKTQDQRFRIYLGYHMSNIPGGFGYAWSGAAVLLIKHEETEKSEQVIWKEICRDV